MTPTHASTLHETSLVWDAHCDSLMRAVAGVDLGEETTGQCDLPKWKTGGVDVQVFAVWVDSIYGRHHAARRALAQIDAFHNFLERYPDRVGLALDSADVRRLRGAGKLAAILAIEGGLAMQNSLALLRTFHRLGARTMTLCHSASLDWVDSSTDVPKSGGLSAFGREVIAELNRLRMMVDVSHVSDDGIRAVLDTSSAPVIASHSSAKALCDHPRNLSDELLRAIAAQRGVVGINFYAEFMDQGYRDRMAASHDSVLEKLNRPYDIAPEDLDAASEERGRTFWSFHFPRPPFERIAEHIDHAVQVAGIDHVGIGADLDSGPIPTPLGLDTVADYPRITDALVARGYTDADIGKLLGENWLRVFGEVTGG